LGKVAVRPLKGEILQRCRQRKAAQLDRGEAKGFTIVDSRIPRFVILSVSEESPTLRMRCFVPILGTQHLITIKDRELFRRGLSIQDALREHDGYWPSF